MLEGRDKEIKESLVSRDKFWSNNMGSYNDIMTSLYYEQINMRNSIKSKALRQGDLINSNVDMLS